MNKCFGVCFRSFIVSSCGCKGPKAPSALKGQVCCIISPPSTWSHILKLSFGISLRCNYDAKMIASYSNHRSWLPISPSSHFHFVSAVHSTSLVFSSNRCTGETCFLSFFSLAISTQPGDSRIFTSLFFLRCHFRFAKQAPFRAGDHRAAAEGGLILQ